MEEQKTAEPQQAGEQVVTPSPFARDAWSETLPEAKQESPAQTQATTEQTQQLVVETKPIETKTEDEEEILDPNEWLKREYGVDNADALKAEREEYKRLKEQKPEEVKWENEQSKQIHELIRQGKRKEVREFLETQERLEAFTTADVTKDTAPDIIKLGMQLSNKLLTKEDVEFQYKQEYGLPKEPKQRDTETEEEFAERVEEYKERVANIEMKKVVAAKMAIPQLEQLKSKIVLPEIEKPKVVSQEPSQESLEAMRKIRESFLNQLESNYSKVEGFTTKVKDESVDIPITFKIPDEDKIAIKGRLSQDFDVENYIGERWFDDKGNPKVDTIISDIYELENRDKIHSGIANNAAAKRLAEYIKAEKNPTTLQTAQNTFQPNQNGYQKAASPCSRDAWTEKPPIIQS